MKRLLLLILVLCMVPCAVFADEIYVKRGENNAPGFAITGDEIVSRTAPRLLINCQFSKLEANVVGTERGNFTLLTIPKFQSSNVVGNPKVPMMTSLIELPFGATPVVRVVSSTETEYSLKDLGVTSPLMPCQPSLRKDYTTLPLVYNEAAYQKDGYERAELATITEAGIMRNVRLFSLEVAPIAYNPAQGKIKVYNDLALEITLEGTNLTETATVQQQYASPYFAWVNDNVMTPASMSSLRADITRYPVNYVIVADRMFANDLKPLIEWKTAKGFLVTVAYTDTIGKTKEDIQKYLHGLYKNATPTNPAPTFVLLVGDLEQIPAFAGTAGSYVTDLYYVAVTADKIPDMYCGRLSAKTADQLIPQIQKTLEYEKYLMPDVSFLKRIVLVAGWDSSHAVEWGWPQVNYAAKYYFTAANGYDKVSLFLTSGSGQNVAKIVSLVSEGASFVNYTAHGSQTDWSDPNFTKANIESLQNKSSYPLVVGNCCLTNSFQIDVCFGEAWLRAKDKGAIGYIGGSSYTYWDEDLWWGNGYYQIAYPNAQGLPPAKEQTGDGAYDCAIAKDAFSNAAVMLSGNLAVEASTSSRKVYYWEVYHLLGDPSVMVYWGVPTKLTVTNTFDAASKSLVVKSEPNAYVGVSAAGTLLGAALTDSTGQATIKLTGSATEALLVVTKKNRQPYQATVKLGQ